MTDQVFSRIISSFSMYKFISALTTPFNQMPAYKSGVIDTNGIQIVPDNQLTPVQQKSFTDFDRLVISLKRIIVMVPDPWVRSYMKSPVTAVKLMSEECEKMGGDPQYFIVLAARELLACQYINEETAAAIANSVGGEGISGLKPETLGIPVSAQKRHIKNNQIIKRKKPITEESTEEKTKKEFGGSNVGLSKSRWTSFLGKGMLRAAKHYITREGESVKFGSKGSPPTKTSTSPATSITTSTTIPVSATPALPSPTLPSPVIKPAPRKVKAVVNSGPALPPPVKPITDPKKMLPDLSSIPVFAYSKSKKKISDTLKITPQFKVKRKYNLGSPVSGIGYNLFGNRQKARKKKNNNSQMTFGW